MAEAAVAVSESKQEPCAASKNKQLTRRHLDIVASWIDATGLECSAPSEWYTLVYDLFLWCVNAFPECDEAGVQGLAIASIVFISQNELSPGVHVRCNSIDYFLECGYTYDALRHIYVTVLAKMVGAPVISPDSFHETHRMSMGKDACASKGELEGIGEVVCKRFGFFHGEFGSSLQVASEFHALKLLREAHGEDCKHFPKILGVSEMSMGVCLYLEFIPGTLKNVTNEKGTIRQLVEAVKMMHDAGVAHRDLKFHNIGMRKNGDVVIYDFDSAATIAPFERFTKPICTIATRPPDLDNETNITLYDGFKLDMWSLGIVILGVLRNRQYVVSFDIRSNEKGGCDNPRIMKSILRLIGTDASPKKIATRFPDVQREFRAHKDSKTNDMLSRVLAYHASAREDAVTLLTHAYFK